MTRAPEFSGARFVCEYFVELLRFAHGGGDAGFAGFFLHVIEFLFGVVDGFLFVGDLLFVVSVFLVPVGGVADAVAGVGVHGGGANLVFALEHVEFAGEKVDLVFLRGELCLPLFVGRLTFGFGSGRVGR